MHVNDFDLPVPGSIVVPILQGATREPLYTVVAAHQETFPGPWTQYFLIVLGDDRVIDVSSEKHDFHNHWHVLHRP